MGPAFSHHLQPSSSHRDKRADRNRPTRQALGVVHRVFSDREDFVEGNGQKTEQENRERSMNVVRTLRRNYLEEDTLSSERYLVSKAVGTVLEIFTREKDPGGATIYANGARAPPPKHQPQFRRTWRRLLGIYGPSTSILGPPNEATTSTQVHPSLRIRKNNRRPSSVSNLKAVAELVEHRRPIVPP
ncbi:uncharacterized protein LOC117227521 [Megalopta genalis]|uniref:uncharacterized protein LOC117227521 n=1 Tax=Megalopta genalis TaxID=115081 RepID=UPI003FD3C25D